MIIKLRLLSLRMFVADANRCLEGNNFIAVWKSMLPLENTLLIIAVATRIMEKVQSDSSGNECKNDSFFDSSVIVPATKLARKQLKMRHKWIEKHRSIFLIW